MLPALRVREVGAVVLVHGQAEAAFEAADVVFEKVWVFVEIYGFESEFAQAFAAVGVRGRLGCYSAAAEFGAGSVLEGGLVGCEVWKGRGVDALGNPF